MLADADPLPRDHRILAGFGPDDLDPTSLSQYRQRGRSAKGDHPWFALDDRSLLERLGGWRRDPGTGEEGLTLAGLLMFGKDGPIRGPEAAPNYFVDYRERLDPTTRWSDRIYPDGTWEANLFQFYSRVWPKLAAGLPTPFRLEDGIRRDVTPAHEALREAFVNALIHADYAGAGGVVVERYPDRFVVENPGTLLISPEQYLRGGVSECRNKALQQMFLMIGGGERAGSGADKIRSGWRAQHWRAPQIVMHNEPDRVGLTLPMVSLIPAETLARLRERFGRHVDALSPAEVQALATADLEGPGSNARLQELLPDHPADITDLLRRLCERELLLSDNRRRWTTYRLGGGQPGPPLFERTDSEGPSHDSSHLPEASSLLAGDSSHLAPDSSHLPAEPPSVRPDLQELRAIAAPVARQGRASTEVIRRVIRRLCAGRFLTAEELASLLDRTAANLRSRHLTPMLAAGHLRLRYPNSPNRPDQSYTATDEE